MAVSAGLTSVLLLSLVALYKNLAPIKTNNSTIVNATSKFNMEQEAGQGKLIHTFGLSIITLYNVGSCYFMIVTESDVELPVCNDEDLMWYETAL